MVRKSFKFIIAFVAALALSVGGLSSVAAFSAPLKTVSTSSTEVANRAVNDLRSCLAQTPILNVYFLVDDSGSLYTDQAGDSATDPEMVRADILSNSLTQLAKLTESSEGQDPIELNYAMGFFSVEATDAIGWTSVNPSNASGEAANLNSVIRADRPKSQRSWTYWDVGINNAQRQLAEKAATPGCEALIWFTDGGINYGNNAAKTNQALANICGQPVNGANPEAGPGPFHEMRQSGVSIFGVLFNKTNNPEEEFQRDYLGPLIEGTGQVQGTQVTCGAGAIGPHDTGGELIVATNVDDLAFEFIRLSSYVSGGEPSDGLGADGTFAIDPGVRSFKLIVAQPLDALSLTGPSGEISLSDSKQVALLASGNTTQISVTPQNASDFGKWKLSGADSSNKALILYGGLVITPEKSNKVTLGEKAKISFNATTSNPSLMSIKDYTFNFTISQINQAGEVVVLKEIPGNKITEGVNTFEVTPLSDQPNARFWFTASKLKTALNGQALSEVRTFQEITAVVPGMFPTVEPSQLVLSNMVGSVTPAEGELTLIGPAEEASAEICMPDGGFKPEIKSDSVDRSSGWTWTLESASGADISNGCITLARGEKQKVTVTALNKTSAQSTVTGYFSVIAKSSDGKTLPVSIDFSFKSERKIDGDKLFFVTLLLVLLGALLPLLVLYIVNLVTTKIEHGDLARGNFDGKISFTNDDVMVRDGGSEANIELSKISKPEERFPMLPPKSDASTISYPDLDTFKRIIPLIPFRSPWFEVTAPAGYAVFTGGVTSPLKAARYKSGTRAPFSGQMSTTWLVLVPLEELGKSANETVPARIVIFAKPGRGGSEWTKQRLIQVSRDIRLAKKISALRESILKRKPEKSSNAGNSPTSSGSTPPPPPGFGGSVPPPPPPTGFGGSVPPPPPPGFGGPVPPPTI